MLHRLSALIVLLFAGAAFAADRPNILWISCEDISPHLGCYGDAQATTPNLDRLATRGVIHTQAHHIHGVCRPARTGIILGMYPTSLGINHMRCAGRLPEDVKPFPQYLREAGYYCTNNSKTDYAFNYPLGNVWNANSGNAHWRNRPSKDTPFFAVFNLTVCHESGVWAANHRQRTKNLPKELFHDPAKMTLPAYYPDTPETRKSMARLYDVITVMDRQAGEILKQLEDDGLADNTIVIFWSDHGDGLPRAKRWIYDSGTRVPMIVHIPEKFRTGDYARPGTRDDRLVSMIDLAPTMLRLAGVELPQHLHGQPFFGGDLPAPRRYIHGGRDRIDERYDMVRMVRDERYRYVRNYMPWYTWLRVLDYAERNEIRQEMRRLDAAGELAEVSAQWLKAPRPYEELYDTQADPDEVRNLVSDPKHAEVLARMRAECDRWMDDVGDGHLLPEPLLDEAERDGASRRTLIEGEVGVVRARRLRVVAAGVASGSAPIEQLIAWLSDDDPAARWWAAMGLGNRPAEAAPAADALRKAMADDAPVVRAAAARAIDRLGDTDAALPVLTALLEDRNEWVRLYAITVLDEMDDRARPALDAIQQTAKGQPNKYIVRVAEAALDDLK